MPHHLNAVNIGCGGILVWMVSCCSDCGSAATTEAVRPPSMQKNMPRIEDCAMPYRPVYTSSEVLTSKAGFSTLSELSSPLLARAGKTNAQASTERIGVKGDLHEPQHVNESLSPCCGHALHPQAVSVHCSRRITANALRRLVFAAGFRKCRLKVPHPVMDVSIKTRSREKHHRR